MINSGDPEGEQPTEDHLILQKDYFFKINNFAFHDMM